MKTKDNNTSTPPAQRPGRRGRIVEVVASAGMILLLAGMFLPLIDKMSTEHLSLFKWVFAAGAAMFWGARCVSVGRPGESLRLRRLRRLEFWAGACFGVAAFFWFYNESKLSGPGIGPLAILKDTILFALAGAVLQLVAAWMIYYRQKKETGTMSDSGKQ